LKKKKKLRKKKICAQYVVIRNNQVSQLYNCELLGLLVVGEHATRMRALSDSRTLWARHCEEKNKKEKKGRTIGEACFVRGQLKSGLDNRGEIFFTRTKQLVGENIFGGSVNSQSI
jgi:hypothetical protein